MNLCVRFQLSEDVRQRMREASHSSEKPQSPKPESRKPDPGIRHRHHHHLTLDTTFFLFIQRLCHNVISASVPFTHKTTVMKGVVLLFFSYNALMACFTAPGGRSSAEMPEELRKRSVIFSSPERVSKCV